MRHLFRALALALGVAASPALADQYDQDRRGQPLALTGTSLVATIAGSGVASGTLTVLGKVTTGATAVAVRGAFNVHFDASSVFGGGTCEVDRMLAGGTTFTGLGAFGTVFTWGAPSSDILSEPEAGVLYQVKCANVTSVLVRISQ